MRLSKINKKTTFVGNFLPSCVCGVTELAAMNGCSSSLAGETGRVVGLALAGERRYDEAGETVVNNLFK